MGGVFFLLDQPSQGRKERKSEAKIGIRSGIGGV